jgi:hypothetical protein
MKKGIIVLMAVYTAAAWGADLDPNAGRAQAMGNQGVYPWNQTPTTLWARGDACPDMGWVDAAYDSKVWNYADPNNPKQAYLYMVFKFLKPGGYSSGDLKWRIWGTSGFETKIWRWNHSTNVWVHIDSVSGTNPSVQTYSYIPANWFNANNELYIMATVGEGPTTHNIIADRIDIQW